MVPFWLHYLSIGYLVLGGLCAAFIAVDVTRHPQHMWIMNVVWPVTALFGTLWIIWQYLTYGRLATHEKMHAAMQQDQEPPNKRDTPFPIMVANGALHCGSGCTLGDIVAEWLVFGVPAIAVAFGYGSLFGHHIFAVWVVDYIFAYLFGIFFQYFTIAPMRGLSVGPGLVAAIKADTLLPHGLAGRHVRLHGLCLLLYLFRIVLRFAFTHQDHGCRILVHDADRHDPSASSPPTR